MLLALEQGIDINQYTNSYGRRECTGLELAIRYRQYRAVRLLMAQPSIVLTSEALMETVCYQRASKDPFKSIATYWPNPRIVGLLLSHPALRYDDNTLEIAIDNLKNWKRYSQNEGNSYNVGYDHKNYNEILAMIVLYKKGLSSRQEMLMHIKDWKS